VLERRSKKIIEEQMSVKFLRRVGGDKKVTVSSRSLDEGFDFFYSRLSLNTAVTSQDDVSYLLSLLLNLTSIISVNLLAMSFNPTPRSILGCGVGEGIRGDG